MRLLSVIAASAFVLGAMSAADAQQTRSKPVDQVQGSAGSTYMMSRDEQGRTRTKVLVQKRSYLDGGTEVMPGGLQTNQTNMVDSLYRNPSRASVSNDNIVPSRPIPDPFFLPGKNNPFYN
ncbi:MAG: hypothetical protein NTV56_16390 [Alphaproteobacteria bacterium]|nr:hypothetical protein [Alphaproteobacteria bacterium]